jgi:glycosyltransferase involved in cell wall biosynthesis
MNERTQHASKRIVVVGSYANSLIAFRGPLLRRLVAEGHQVIACAPSASDDIIETLETMGVVYRDVPFDRAGMRPDRDFRVLRALIALFRELKPDVVLSYTIKPVIYGMLAAGLAGVPGRFAMITGLGYTFIGSTVKARLVGLATRQLYRLSLRRAKRVFFQNPDDQALFERYRLTRGPEQTAIINGSGVDLELFRPAPLPDDGSSFLLIARLLTDKGIREYVDAARQVRARYPGATFHLVGWLDEGNPAGISKAELDGWVAEGVVHYHGKLDDVRPMIAATSVYVLPSYREGPPRTVLEAMAMGRPVVTTDAPGCRETVEHGENGFLVPVRDADRLAEAMTRFVEEPALIETMGRRSRQIAERKYDVYEVNNVILRTMGLAA